MLSRSVNVRLFRQGYQPTDNVQNRICPASDHVIINAKGDLKYMQLKDVQN